MSQRLLDGLLPVPCLLDAVARSLQEPPQEAPDPVVVVRDEDQSGSVIRTRPGTLRELLGQSSPAVASQTSFDGLQERGDISG